MKTIVGRIVRYFFSGTLFIVPLIATGYFIYKTFEWLDGLMNFSIPGLGVLIIIGAFTFFGYLATTFAFRTFFDFFEHSINRIPLVKLIYSSLKDLIEAFVGDKKKFNRPVIITINKENNLYQFGFVTQDDLREINLPDLVAVYIPQSYAFAGNHFLVPRENVKPVDIPGQVAMKFIVSGGISGLKE